mmetsp:Transcript_381/g.821  ORF Transcript_381/g.821 Transcript_381/m.821 type:complete len:141 (-) Transcript_381:188-610(-)
MLGYPAIRSLTVSTKICTDSSTKGPRAAKANNSELDKRRFSTCSIIKSWDRSMSFCPEFDTTKQLETTTKKRETKAANPKEEKSWVFKLLLFLVILKSRKQSMSRKLLMVEKCYRFPASNRWKGWVFFSNDCIREEFESG